MKFVFYFTVLSTCTVLQVSSHKYENLYKNLFATPVDSIKNIFIPPSVSHQTCPLKTVCVGVISCYHTLSACGHKINLNKFVMDMNNKRCSTGVCCPLGTKCYKKIRKLFPNVMWPMEKLVMSTTIKTEITTKNPETTPKTSETTPKTPENMVKPPETTAKPPKTTVKPPETTAKPPDTTVKPPETTVKPPDTTVKPPETTAKPPETTAKPPETTVKPPETTPKPPETTPKPPETTVKPPETTAKPPETTAKPPETTKSPETTKPPETTTMKPDIVTISKNYTQFTSHPNFALLAGEHCGFGLNSRIAYGEEVAPGELPWLVMLRYRANNKLVFRCGGALISSRYVITAAHCLIDKDKSFALVSVRLGEINLSSMIDCVTVEEEVTYLDIEFTNTLEKCSKTPQDIKIEAAIPHPMFRLQSILKGFPHDIGLVRLAREAELSEFVKPICMVGLASPELRGDGGIDLQNFEVAGWGMVDMSKDPLSNVLRKVNVMGLSPAKCFELLKRKVNNCQLCAGGMHGNTCHGDSGGPLMAKVLGKPGETCPLLVGIVSYGTKDCGYKTPSVFCDASCYLQWILDNVKE